MSELGDELRDYWGLRETGYCYCGCGGRTGGHVVPGHDPKVGVNLLRQLRGDRNIARVIGEMGNTRGA